MQSNAFIRDGRLNALFVEMNHGNVHSANGFGRKSDGMA